MGILKNHSLKHIRENLAPKLTFRIENKEKKSRINGKLHLSLTAKVSSDHKAPCLLEGLIYGLKLLLTEDISLV